MADLFTSEGCNSCPPADAALELLLHVSNPVHGVYVIALNEHVTDGPLAALPECRRGLREDAGNRISLRPIALHF